jgi:hypothetical protein
MDNEITNTYNAAKDGGQWDGRLIAVESGASISGSEVNVEFGRGRPPELPEPFPSSPDERIKLRDQLRILANEVDPACLPKSSADCGGLAWTRTSS